MTEALMLAIGGLCGAIVYLMALVVRLQASCLKAKEEHLADLRVASERAADLIHVSRIKVLETTDADRASSRERIGISAGDGSDD